MLARHTKILELITENKKMEVTKLSQLLSVSQVTIRKDLIQLENSGLIVREHGFATLNSSDDINNRLAYHYDIKQRIAKLAVESIEDGETVMIESGSCCALVALEIAQTKKMLRLLLILLLSPIIFVKLLKLELFYLVVNIKMNHK